MKLTHSAASVSLSVALLAALIAACGGSDVTPGGSGGAGGFAAVAGAGGASSTDTCTVDDDCTFGEIETEILKPSDCMCLYGCVYLPQTKMTVARRTQQHQKLCKPDVDGQGQACGIDDCAVPGSVACVDGACKARSTDPQP